MFNRLVYVTSPQLRHDCDKIPVVKKRASMVHELITAYHLDNDFNVVEPRLATVEELRLFHTDAYVKFLQTHDISDGSENCCSNEPKTEDDDEDDHNDDDDDDDPDVSLEVNGDADQLAFGLAYDCPPLANLWPLARRLAGASLTAAEEVLHGARIVINWCGGWHHAQRSGAEGFCYVNDIGIAIRKLRERYGRILYVDLDVHHGNGVERAFGQTPHVFTLSFHQFEAGFFPGSGKVGDVGSGRGAGYSCNFPYRGFVTGDMFVRYFKKVVERVRRAYRPEVCIVQCGGDALAGDPLGGTNLSAVDLGACVRLLLGWHLPTILLGGGGYQLPNTARYWTYLTAMVCGRSRQLDDDIPDNRFFLAYGPGYEMGVAEQLEGDADNAARRKRLQPKDFNSEDEFAEQLRQIEENLEKYKVGKF